MTAARTRKAWDVITQGCKRPNVVFAKRRATARAEMVSLLRDAWGCSWKEALGQIIAVVRYPENDVHLPPRHPLAGTLHAEILHCVCHAFGGTGMKAGHRDHFYADEDNWALKAALYHGLFRVFRRDKGQAGRANMIMYELTDLGRNVARGEVKTYPGCWE